MQGGSAKTLQFTFPWMFGPWLDFAIYYASAALGILLLVLSQSPVAAIGMVFFVAGWCSTHGIGEFHGGASWYSYLDKRNRAYYNGTVPRFITFILGPWLVVLASMLLAVYSTDLLYGIFILWTIQHLTQQNVGILLLYHNHNAGEAIVPRKIELNSLYSAAILCTLIVCKHTNLFFFGAYPHVKLIVILASFWTAAAIILYLFALCRQVSEGKAMNVPAFMFWVISVLFFAPSTVISAGPFKTLLIPLMMHWFQYIGLNYMLTIKKYSSAQQRQFLPLSHPLVLLTLVGSGTVLGLIFMSFLPQPTVAAAEWKQRMAYGFGIGLSNIHYYVDAIIWRFREPFQREAVIPYLLAWRKRPPLVET